MSWASYGRSRTRYAATGHRARARALPSRFVFRDQPPRRRRHGRHRKLPPAARYLPRTTTVPVPRAGAPLTLTPVEYELLLSLARAKGRVKTRDHLLEEIRDRDYEVFDRSIDGRISALRKKLGDDPKTPRFFRTVRASGYLLIDPDAD